MNILGILGSSRPGGNTEILLDIALEKARSQGEETSKVNLRELSIKPCDGCNGCFSTARFSHQAEHRIALDAETDVVDGPHGYIAAVQKPAPVEIFYQVVYRLQCIVIFFVE